MDFSGLRKKKRKKKEMAEKVNQNEKEKKRTRSQQTNEITVDVTSLLHIYIFLNNHFHKTSSCCLALTIFLDGF